MTIEQLTTELLGLPAKTRANLAEKLLGSLEEEEVTPDVDAAWAQEADRRLKEIDDGSVACRPFEQVLEQARAGHL